MTPSTPTLQKSILAITGLFVGLLLVQQYNAYQKLSRSDVRDQGNNPFREIKILEENNDRLTEEVRSLEAQLKGYNDQAQQFQELHKDIEKNQILAGDVAVAGPGISIEISQNVELIWLVDLVNELFAAGAEAIQINGIRVTHSTLGFIAIGDQITLQKITLRPPFRVEAIGDRDSLEKAMEQGGSILKRLQARYPEATIGLKREESVTMKSMESV